jgi:hypothetical protein
VGPAWQVEQFEQNMLAGERRDRNFSTQNRARRVIANFSCRQSLLKVRPIWDQREDRVQAHILVCFLGFVLWKSLEMWQQRAGLGNSPRKKADGVIRSRELHSAALQQLCLRKAGECGRSTVAPPRASGVKEGAPISLSQLSARRASGDYDRGSSG